MKKILLLAIIILTLFNTNKVFASTVYSQPYVGEDLSIGTNVSISINYYQYFPSYVNLGNPPVANQISVSSYNKIRLKIVSGTMTCSELGNPATSILQIYTSSTTSISPSGGSISGDYCDISLASSYTSFYSVSIVAGNHFETDVIIDRSSFNSGKSVNGTNTGDKSGGFAFQLCNSSCDEDFIENEYTTRFISIDPYFEEVVSTTTDIGAEIYINEDDYEEGMYLSMSFTNQSMSLIGGSALDAFNSATDRGQEIKIPLVVGNNSVSTSTTFLSAGKTEGTWTIKNDGFLSGLPFIGFLFSSNNLISTSSYFYVGYATGLDNAVDQGGASVAQYILTGTTTGANTIVNCGDILNGGITPCLVSLVVPNSVTFSADMTRLRNGFLSVWPLGYITRFIEILTTTSTSSLPVISYTTASSSMFGIIDIDLDPFGSLSSSDSPMLFESDGTNPKTIWEIMEYPTYVVVGLMLLFMIIHDLTGVSKHSNHKKR